MGKNSVGAQAVPAPAIESKTAQRPYVPHLENGIYFARRTARDGPHATREGGMKKVLSAAGVALFLSTVMAEAAPIYVMGTAAPCGTCTFGTHLPEGPNGSIPGVGGSGINGPAGTMLDGQPTYIWDQGGWVDGTVTRGDNDFAMMVW